jgi:hypothetical protein
LLLRAAKEWGGEGSKGERGGEGNEEGYVLEGIFPMGSIID